MFYAQFVLAKKGPLAKIWLAAHWEKKLTKAQIYETDVPQAIEEVIRPKVKMALRTVGHLLLGIVRIYSKKTRYLLADTNEAYLKMKINFRDGFSFEAELPHDAEIDEDFENIHDDFNITVPEFHDADYNEKLIMANVSRLEDITIKDDCNFNAMFQINVNDDGFGDEAVDYDRLDELYGSVEPSSIRPTPQPESQHFEQERARDGTVNNTEISKLAGDSVLFDGQVGTGFEDVDFGTPMNVKMENQTVGPEMMQDLFSSMIHPDAVAAPPPEEPMDVDYEDEGPAPEPPRAPSPDSFALEPLDLDNLDGGKKKRQRRPRRLMVDAETMISNDEFREQQEDFSDTMQACQMAPPTRKMMKLCVTGTLPHLMNAVGSEIRNEELIDAYRSCLVVRAFDPNYTMQELSDSSSCPSSADRPSAPWEDLDLNEHIQEDLAQQPGPAGIDDDFFDDFEMGAPDFEAPNRTMDMYEEMAEAPAPQQPEDRGEFQNKENEVAEEEDWSDPFGSSDHRGRLEAYGFGSGARKPQQEDEGKWAKRANHILKKIAADIEEKGQADFSTVTETAKTRKQAAEQFYSLLSLAKSQAIHVEQSEPFGEIVLRPGDNYKEALNPSKSDETFVGTPRPTDTLRTPMRLI